MIPLPYKILGALALVIGAYFVGDMRGRADVHQAWELANEKAAVDALREKGRLETQYRAREAAQAEITRNMEADYAKRLVAVETERGAFERRLADRLRAQTDRADHCDVSSTPSDSSRPEVRPPGETGLGRIDPFAVSRVRALAKETQETLRLCREWATSVGR